ncbi:MAG: ATP-binding cassette domain-containing protein [Chloroflexi bacterium]|nr:ATP-binding cassette domain-containing protein [Chloroflexota bacterium]
MGDAAIQVENLTKTYRVERRRPGRLSWVRSLVAPMYEEIRGVDRLSLAIDHGEVLGLLGPNGAGKSTAVKLLTGVLFPTEGRVRVLGRDPFHDRIANAQDIGVLFGQRSHLLHDLPAVDSFGLLRHLYGTSQSDYDARLTELTDLPQLEPLLNQPVRTLSLGQRMRCEVAATFLHQPRIVYLDEPTIGLDIEAKRRIREFILSVSRSLGTTVLLTTHDLNDVQELCERVVVLNQGSAVFDGLLGDLIDLHASSRAVEVDAPGDVIEMIVQDVSRRWPEALVTRDGSRVRASGIGDQGAIVDATRLIMAHVGVRSISVVEPPIEDVILSVYQHGVRGS